MDEKYYPVTLTIILGVEASKTQLTIALSNLLCDQTFATITPEQKIIALKHALMTFEEKVKENE